MKHMSINIERVETTLRLSAYVAILLFAGHVAYELLSQRAATAAARERVASAASHVVGQRIVFPESMPASDSRSLVMLLSTDCYYCAASIPFYRHLFGQVLPKMNNSIRTVAIMPEPLRRSRAYLESTVGIHVDVVQRGHIRNITGTPALILLNRNGIAEAVWLGQQNDEGQRRIVAALEAK